MKEEAIQEECSLEEDARRGERNVVEFEVVYVSAREEGTGVAMKDLMSSFRL